MGDDIDAGVLSPLRDSTEGVDRDGTEADDKPVEEGIPRISGNTYAKEDVEEAEDMLCDATEAGLVLPRAEPRDGNWSCLECSVTDVLTSEEG